MKKHWTAFLPSISPIHHLIAKRISEQVESVEQLETLAGEMRKALDKSEAMVREEMRKHYSEDEITAAIGKAMAEEINQAQPYEKQSITFTSL